MPPGWEYEVQYIDIYVYINSFSWDKSLIESKECYYQHPAIINNKAREKYFKNNKAINYGHEKAISFLKLLYKSSVWLKLYMLKWSQVTPPPHPEKCILPYFILILFRLLTLICLHPISMNWCIWLKFKVFHQAMHIFLHISWLVRHTVQIHAIRPRPQRKSVHFRVST